jgi:hypothetical protein
MYSIKLTLDLLVKFYKTKNLEVFNPLEINIFMLVSFYFNIKFKIFIRIRSPLLTKSFLIFILEIT